jgi:hypothetical protein
MAAPDSLRIPSRSADRRTDDQLRANHAALGPAAHVLSLQRALGNRATAQLVRSWVQRALRGQPGIVSAAGNGRLDVVTGPRILEEFARNDPRSVPNLVGVPPAVIPSGLPGDRWMLDDQEWGLIAEKATGEVHLISGQGGQVTWGPYLDEGTPLAHSHPWRKGEKRQMAVVGPHSITALLPDQAGGAVTQQLTAARNIIVPTVSDFVLPATLGQREHTVFTPYEVDAQGNVRNPRGAGVQRLVWELSEIQLDRSSADKSEHRVTGRLTAKRGNAPFWTRVVQAPAANDTETLKSTRYEVIRR